jgi:putative membrane protein
MELLSSYQPGNFISQFIVNMLGLFIGARIMSSVYVENFTKGLVVALVIAILNVTLGGILDFLSMPIRWITLGLFSFVVDALMILLASYLMKGFSVKGFWSAVGLAIVIAITNVLFDWVF